MAIQVLLYGCKARPCHVRNDYNVLPCSVLTTLGSLILNVMSAKHILVVADSCYSGTLTRSSLAQLEAGMTREARIHRLKTMTKKRSRTALTSGGLVPVLDAGGGQHSVFAKAFSEIIEGARLYREVAVRVAYAANRLEVEQVPEYAPIKYAGHDFGDFFFVPVAAR